jgi:hypothetical protein
VKKLSLGVQLAWTFLSIGALWPSILAHAFHNGVVLILGVDR